MRKFNFDEAKNGAPVQTRDGRKARIICFDAKDKNHYKAPIVALVSNSDGDDETNIRYGVRGNYRVDDDDVLDLFMAPTKHEGWVNIYRNVHTGQIRVSEHSYETELDACGMILDNDSQKSYIATCKIEWEE